MFTRDCFCCVVLFLFFAFIFMHIYLSNFSWKIVLKYSKGFHTWIIWLWIPEVCWFVHLTALVFHSKLIIFCRLFLFWLLFFLSCLQLYSRFGAAEQLWVYGLGGGPVSRHGSCCAPLSSLLLALFLFSSSSFYCFSSFLSSLRPSELLNILVLGHCHTWSNVKINFGVCSNSKHKFSEVSPRSRHIFFEVSSRSRHNPFYLIFSLLEFIIFISLVQYRASYISSF